MHWLFDINSTVVKFSEYSLSYLELFSVLAALLTVWLAAKNNIHTWTVNLFAVSGFFLLFYQTQLYADMLLQIFFFCTSFIGFALWKKPKNKISSLKFDSFLSWVLKGGFAALGLGVINSKLHVVYPMLFPLPAAFPLSDAFTTVFSVIATIFLIQRKIQAWVLWIAVDLISCFVYFHRGLYLVSLEYLLFLFMAIYGFFAWRNEMETEIKFAFTNLKR